MKLFPSTKSISLRWTLLGLTLACGWPIARGIILVATGHLQGLFTIGLFVLLGVGLWLRLHVARALTLVILWFVAIFLPLGLINPFAAMDNPDPNPPSALHLALLIYPWVAAALLVIHILGKHKGEFRWWPRAAA